MVLQIALEVVGVDDRAPLFGIGAVFQLHCSTVAHVATIVDHR